MNPFHCDHAVSTTIWHKPTHQQTRHYAVTLSNCVLKCLKKHHLLQHMNNPPN